MKIVYLDLVGGESNAVRGWLEKEGHECIQVEQSDLFVEVLQSPGVDLAVINWDLEGINPQNLVVEATRARENAPIIVASDAASRSEITHALSQYHCEFMQRPFQRDELLARIDTIWQHMGIRDATPQYGAMLGPWKIDSVSREIHLKGRPVPLTEKDFDVASFFFRNVGKALSRREMLREVWGINAPVETRTVDVHVSRIRKSLEIDGEHGYRIRNVYQHGYRLESVGD